MHESSSEHFLSSAFINKAWRYNVSLVVWILALLAFWAIGLKGLERLDRLPAPPVTATYCIDEKFKFLHEKDFADATFLAVGSSVTMHSAKLSMLKEHYGESIKPVNGAVCYLRINQTAELIDFYLEHMSKVRTVFSLLAMRDFEGCGDNPTEFFDREDAAAYVFEKDPSWHLYFKNFRLASFYGEVLRLPKMRSGADLMNPLNFTPFGSIPLKIETPDPRRDVVVDDTCMLALRDLSRSLAQRGINFVVMLMPPMPAWIEKYDPDGARDASYRALVAANVDANTVLIDTAKDLPLADQHFTDPGHLHWDSVPILMHYLIAKLEQLGKSEVFG